MKDLRCMSFTSKGTAEIIVAGLQDMMLVIDLNKGEVVKQVSTPSMAPRNCELTGCPRCPRSISIPS